MKFCLIITIVVAVFVATTTADNTTTIAPTTTASTTPTTVATTKTTTTTTPAANTTTHMTTTPVGNTTTPASNTTTLMTTTPATNTTTPATNTTTLMTTTSATNTTTPASNTTTHMTTTPVANTTVAPLTTQSPVVTFDVKDKDGKSCLTVVGEMKLEVIYKNGQETKNKTLVLVKGAKVTGKCSDLKKGNETSSIKMSWNDLDVTMNFIGGEKWYLNSLLVDIDGKAFNATDHLKANMIFSNASNDGFYQAPFNHTYSCMTEEKVKLSSVNSTQYNITMDLNNIKFQPFQSDGDVADYACPQKTDPDNSSSIVPIAVGCALAGLIVIVLLAYLIGRRRGASRGYQQV
jgi:hypothetical protein